MADDPYEAFNRDIPEHLREEVMTAMAEATSGWGEPSNVHILEHDRIDAINARAEGIVTVEGKEYTFQMENGNWNGTVLLAWQSDKPFEYHEPTRWALQPKRDLIDQAIESGKGPFLIMKWDAILANKSELKDLLRNYSYDRYVQPGSVVENHYREKATKHLFDIVLEETANETRKTLERATEPHEPIS